MADNNENSDYQLSCNYLENACNNNNNMESEEYDEEWNRIAVTPNRAINNVCVARSDEPLVYHLKWIKWRGVSTPIVLQNSNGPCALLAIINVLILKGRIQLPSMMKIISDNQLMEYLVFCILNSVPKNITEVSQLNNEQNIDYAMAILPKLEKGLDVNVKFTGVSDFENTPEFLVFDLLHVPLYHGWLVDSDIPEVKSVIGDCSYNQLIDKFIINGQPNFLTEALIAEHFLEKTSSQLTRHGLNMLITNLKDEEICILFRNNHFISLHKHKNELYQLVTDQGFLTENNVVWETLDNIEGDGQFVDGEFVLVPPKAALSSISSQQQIDQDYLVALSLQEEHNKQIENCKEWEKFKHETGMEGLADEDLAKRLQQEEDKRFALQRQQNLEPQQQQSQQQQQQQLRGQSGGNNQNNSNSPTSRRGTNNGSGNNGESDSNKSKSKNCSIV